MTSDARTLRRKYGKCRNCGGFVEVGRDEYRRLTGTCINCGRENIQQAMTAEAIEAMCGVNGGRK